MSKPAFGIDLGTSTSEVSFIVGGKPVPIRDYHPQNNTPIVPSVVALDSKGELLIGYQAKWEGDPNQMIMEAKRNMGESDTVQIGEYHLLPEEVAALVLRQVRQIAEKSTGVELTEAVITVPAYFGDISRRATEKAAILAGIRPLRLISEPVAAALAYGIDRLDHEDLLLVFDFGGGTLDVTIIDMIEGVLEVKATDGDRYLGGKDIDDLLMKYVLETGGMTSPLNKTQSYHLKLACEQCKIRLSSEETSKVSLENFHQMEDLNVMVSRSTFEKLIQPLIERAMAKVEATLKKANLNKSSVKRLLLVGGSSCIPAVQRSVESFFGLQAETGVDRDLAVSMGAAISAGLKTGAIDQHSLVVQDAATHRLGVSCLEDVGQQIMLMFSELLPANAHVPYHSKHRYSLLRLDQDVVEIEVFEDPSNTAQLAADAIRIVSGEICDIPPSTTPEPRALDVTLTFDESHIVRIHAKVVGIEKECTIVLNSDQFSADPLSMLSGSQAVNDLWDKSPLASRHSSFIQKAEKMLETNPARAEVLEAALQDLKRTVAANDGAAADVARERLADIMMDIQ